MHYMGVAVCSGEGRLEALGGRGARAEERSLDEWMAIRRC